MQVHRAVNDAEAVSGLQFCAVRLGGGPEPLIERAQRLCDAHGFRSRPAVLVAVDRDAQEVAVALGPGAEGRLTEEVVDEVLEACSSEPELKARAAAVILTLADRAGEGRAEYHVPHLPDVIEA